MARIDLSKLGEILECAICLEALDETSKVLPCQHCFCGSCLHRIAKTTSQLTCPECRTPFNGCIDDLPSNIVLIRLLHTLKNTKVEFPADCVSSSKPSPDAEVSVKTVAVENSDDIPGFKVTHAVALFPYTGEDDTELSFERHERLQLLERVDDDWYVGQSTVTDSKRRGLVPANYVKILTDDNVNTTFVKKATCLTGQTQIFDSDKKLKATQLDAPANSVHKAVALYDFDASNVIISTGVCDETSEFLAFAKGDLLTIFRRLDENWLVGSLDRDSSRVGLCPSLYVRVVEQTEASNSSQSNGADINQQTVPSVAQSLLTLTKAEIDERFDAPKKQHNSFDLGQNPAHATQPSTSGQHAANFKSSSDCGAAKFKTMDDSAAPTGAALGTTSFATLPRTRNTDSPIKQQQQQQLDFIRPQQHTVRVTTLNGSRTKLNEPSSTYAKHATLNAIQSERVEYVSEMEHSRLAGTSAAASVCPANVRLFGLSKPALGDASTKYEANRHAILRQVATLERRPEPVSHAATNSQYPVLALVDDYQRSRSLTRSATERALLVSNRSLTLASTRARSVERPVVQGSSCTRTSSATRLAVAKPKPNCASAQLLMHVNSHATPTRNRNTSESRRKNGRKSPTAKLWRTLSAGSSRFIDSLRSTVKRIGTHRASVSDDDDDGCNDDSVSVSDDEADYVTDDRIIAPQRRAATDSRLPQPRPARSRSRNAEPPRHQANTCQCNNCRQQRLAQQATLSPRPSRPQVARSTNCRVAGSNMQRVRSGSDEKLSQRVVRAPLYATMCSAVRRFSPQAVGELDVHVGDVIYVLRVRADGWCEAVNARTKDSGFVPSVFLEPVDVDSINSKF